VVTYQFRCDEHGSFDLTLPLGTAPDSALCVVCGSDAKRVFSTPMISARSSRQSREIYDAIDRAEKSADYPEVVTSLPTTGHSTIAGRPKRPTPVLPLNDKLRRLPRP
jgi:putative FmdB family regulatory protein